MHLFLLILNLSFWCSSAFNLNPKHAVVINVSATTDSYFGYAVALHQTSSGAIALIGAPRSNSSVNWKNAREPGTIYRCDLEAHELPCREVVLDIGNEGGKEVTDGMWFGMTLDTTKSGTAQVLACAPRYIVKHSKSQYSGNGACFLLDKNLSQSSTRKVNPLSDSTKQTIFRQSTLYNYFAYGQMGISVHIDQKRNEILLGAPGLLDWIGSLVRYSDKIVKPSIPDLPVEIIQNSYIYAGYSVTSGQFFEHSSVHYVLGAPRDEGHKGQIYVCEMRQKSATTKASFNITSTQRGTEFGEYFGASVLAVNLNGDKFDDLVVGAPMYGKGEKWDQGRIYIYHSSGLGLISQEPCTVKSATAGARFGTTLATLGDLNNDGFQDIAVGAPYEKSQGSVYIFFGSASGLDCSSPQRIKASEVGVKGPGFGMGISRGMDIDRNHYPDLLIGSYGDSKTVLLRSNSVVQVSCAITTDKQQIDVSSEPCLPNPQTSPPQTTACLKVTFRLLYDGKHVPGSLRLLLNASVDRELHSKGVVSRAVIEFQNKLHHQFEEEIFLSKGVTKNVEKKVFIQTSTEKHITPLTFYTTYRIKQESPDPCFTCPVIDRTSVEFAELKVPFKIGCGGGDKCISDLHLSARILEQKQSKDPFVIGIDNVLTIRVDVRNEGEDAYTTRVQIELPSEVSITNIGQCSQTATSPQHKTGLQNLECPVGNPLKNQQTHTLDVKLDASKLDARDQTLRFTVEVLTISETKNSSRNIVELTAVFVTNASLQLIGYSENDVLVFNPASEELLQFRHKYMVRTPYSAIPRVELKVFVPGIQEGFAQISVQASGSASCLSSDSRSNSGRMQRSPQSTKTEPLVQRTTILSCEDMPCNSITCFAGPVDRRNSGIVSIFIHLNLTTLKRKENKELADIELFVSRAEAFISMDRAGTSNATTKLVKLGSLSSEPVPLWIIIVSAIAGVIVLVLLIFGLYKMGFFERPKRTGFGDKDVVDRDRKRYSKLETEDADEETT